MLGVGLTLPFPSQTVTNRYGTFQEVTRNGSVTQTALFILKLVLSY